MPLAHTDEHILLMHSYDEIISPFFLVSTYFKIKKMCWVLDKSNGEFCFKFYEHFAWKLVILCFSPQHVNTAAYWQRSLERNVRDVWTQRGNGVLLYHVNSASWSVLLIAVMTAKGRCEKYWFLCCWYLKQLIELFCE